MHTGRPQRSHRFGSRPLLKQIFFLGGGWFSCAYKSYTDTILVYEVSNSLKNAHALIKNTCCELYFNKNKFKIQLKDSNHHLTMWSRHKPSLIEKNGYLQSMIKWSTIKGDMPVLGGDLCSPPSKMSDSKEVSLTITSWIRYKGELPANVVCWILERNAGIPSR